MLDDTKSISRPQTPEIAAQASTPGVFQRLDLTPALPYPRSWYVRKILWRLAWKFLYRPSPQHLLKFRVWLLRIFGANVPYTVNVRASSSVWHPWLLTMGEFSALAEGVQVYNLGPVSIGSQTVI